MKHLRALAAPAAAVFLAGCVATQRDILDLSQQSDSMTLKINSLKVVMKDLQANQADLNTRLEELHRDVSILTENLKDNRDGMSKLGAKMDDLGAALGGKVSSLGQSISDTLAKSEASWLERDQERRLQEMSQKKAEEERRDREAQAEKAAQEAARKAAAEIAASAPTPTELYRQAKQNYDKKEYDLAAKGFALYVERYPKAELVEDSIYLWGNCFYAGGKFEEAARKYATLLDRFPKSDLTPAARMRYALSLMKLKTHLDEAQRYLQSIPEDFPKSPEAEKAKQLLQKWEETKKQ